MELKQRHIILSILFLLSMTFNACVTDSFDMPPGEKEDNTLYLSFRADVAGAFSRTEGYPDENAIKKLLIVIVSETPDRSGWVMEHQRLVEGASSIGIPLSNLYTFKVRSGCKKRIYLIANYDGLNVDLSPEAFLPGEDGNAPVDKCTFQLPSIDNLRTRGLPMTAKYEIDIPLRSSDADDNEDYVVSETFYLVRAITKFHFSFHYTGTLRTKVDINSITIENVASSSYLMPCVNRNDDGNYWVVDAGGVSPIPLISSSLTGIEWIDWMMEEIEKKDDPTTYQWLTDYTIPDESTQQPYTHHVDNVTVTTVSDPEVIFYLPESRNRKAVPDDDNGLMLQEYRLTLATTATSAFPDNTDNTHLTREYSDVLPHLASLFRNTSVVVDITFDDGDETKLDWEVEVKPYTEVWLDPVFGLDPPPEDPSEDESENTPDPES